ncbi:MAG: class I SAM-dependent methyltransferase [Rectinemataceae bacterium]
MTQTPNPDIDRFDRWAASYDRSVMQRFFFVPIHVKMLELLESQELRDRPARIVDIGCGTGRLLRAVSIHWPTAELFGVDPAERMVSEASRLNPKAVFKLASAESLPFDDRTVDVVLSSMSFHHWGDQRKGIREIVRVLRPGGVLCLADHAFPLARLAGEKVKSRTQVRELAISAGLTILAQKSAGLPFLHITFAQK